MSFPRKGLLPGKALELSQGISCLMTMCNDSHKEYSMRCVSCVDRHACMKGLFTYKAFHVCVRACVHTRARVCVCVGVWVCVCGCAWVGVGGCTSMLCIVCA